MIQWVVQAANPNFVKIFPTVGYCTWGRGHNGDCFADLSWLCDWLSFSHIHIQNIGTFSRKLYIIPVFWIPIGFHKNPEPGQCGSESGSRSLRIRSGTNYIGSDQKLFYFYSRKPVSYLVDKNFNILITRPLCRTSNWQQKPPALNREHTCTLLYSTSKQYLLPLFSCLWDIFAHLDPEPDYPNVDPESSRPKSMWIHAEPVPYPQHCIIENCNFCKYLVSGMK